MHLLLFESLSLPGGTALSFSLLVSFLLLRSPVPSTRRDRNFAHYAAVPSSGSSRWRVKLG
ncbi:hypothetical protein M419DRAFT_120375 [Trichoderma reesei RUT C-30]|uniref:Uncharacterized protein n=1 Tax=Hypocrea jecorina (strain ATCC 56765 / BCRC 32924 / NRRL 11460 / Rut C-30) TaxID=1344414 RepID=A0A024S3I7_HYPJR|nr:hypothetical protein M419DRAFT_120375 [Trichoderma reesei RUT C-30]